MFKNFLGKIKSKVLALAFLFGLCFGVYAEGEAAIDLTAATTQVTAMQTAITTWITTNAPTLVKILAAALVITLIFVGYGWITRASKKAK